MEKNKVPPIDQINTLSVARFLDSMVEENKANQRFCFILGSGASYTSGIRTGETLMRQWRDTLLEKGMDYIKDCVRAARYEWEECRRIFEEPADKLRNEDYFTLYDIRFVGGRSAGYAALEEEMSCRSPNVGYYYLASILDKTDNRLVITTNFDSLTEDALFYYSGKHPLVLGHEKLAAYVDKVDSKPVVAKIHRDLLMEPMNRLEQMKQLQEEWEGPLSAALYRYIPVVVGYAGGDKTLMSLLEKLKLKGIFWCTLDREGEKGLPDAARRIIHKNNGYWIRIQGFDELMYRMANTMDKLPNLAEMHEAMNKRHDDFKQKHEALKNKYSPSSMKDDKDGADQDDLAMQQAVLHEEGRKMPELADYNQLLSDGLTAWKRGDAEQALELYAKAIALDPNCAKGYDYRSTLYHRQGKYELALADAAKTVELEPKNAAYHRSHGVTLHNMGRYEEALKSYTKAMELLPDQANYHHCRAISLHALGRYEEALEDRSRAVELDPDNAAYLQQRSLTLRALDRYEEALADMNKAVNLAPDNALYLHSRALTLHVMRRFDAALEDRDRAVTLEPDNAVYHNQRGVTLHELKRYDEALEAYSRAMELCPNQANDHYCRALTLRSLGRDADALEDAVKATELAPTQSHYWKNRGLILANLGRAEEAKECFAKADELKKK